MVVLLDYILKEVVDMIETLNNVLKREHEITQKVEQHQQFCYTEHNRDEYRERIIEIDDYFDTFTDNEIMVLQSIMYLGRDVMTGEIPFNVKGLNAVLEAYFHELGFKIGERIKKDIEIHQMTGKGLKIGDYFKIGFGKIHQLIAVQ